MRIGLIPNDDGIGPSAFGYYVAKALLREGHSLVVRNESALSVNASFYKDEFAKGSVSLQPTFGGIKMRKTAEGVDVPATLRDICSYPGRSDNYVVPDDVDAVIDIGTPAAARAAHAAAKPVFTVFDHSWGKTYEKTLHNFVDSLSSTLGVTDEAELGDMRSAILSLPVVEKSQLLEAMKRIGQDESKTSTVYLFDYYIAPEPFHAHWKGLDVTIQPISGVFGGKELVDKQHARKRMGISGDAPEKTVYILGGGTSVWDTRVPEILSQMKDRELGFNVVVFDRNAQPGYHQRVGKNLYKIGPVRGGTIQVLLPGVDLIVTRAGGGTVNDAIACRVPFVCVEEPNHWQVEMIRKNCMRERLTRTITIEEFRTGDMAEIVEREFRNEAGNGQIPGNEEIQDKMNGISNGQEDFVVRQILTKCT